MSTNITNLTNYKAKGLPLCMNTMLKFGATNLDNETISNIVHSIRSNKDLYDDVDFTVGNAENANTEQISGIRILFAIQSQPLLRMLFNGNLSESLSSSSSSNHRHKVYIPDVTPAAFHTFKHYCYGSKLCLSMHGIVDLLYIANKYLVSRLSQQCEAKILAETRSNLDLFYKVLSQFQRYSPCTFAPFLAKLMANLQVSSQQIVKDARFGALQQEFAQQYVKHACFACEVDRYQAALSYVQLLQHNNARQVMRASFIPLIDFTRIDLDYLTIVVQKDAIFTDSELLSIITTKIKQNVKAKIQSCCWTQLLQK